ncbi:putative phage protein [Selenomonas ruminantium subsp. lactilytica TAM6421]|uniref:Putative phage protein n=1 Tax=Selenomonas ruminantium subsp. lactilytica (strain NBRC 103574 / TAM6421) TaxID=927704 RepID=I0GRI8_SELRL|nr:phage tail protein [Selenomonas ruminantium]BAL83375.1 putative phage protein [Selenomonas ruminantium subsp. lactilytica TAM6421]
MDWKSKLKKAGMKGLTSAINKYAKALGVNPGAANEIGSLGDVTFKVAAYNDCLTFDEYKRSFKARIAKHDIIASKPVLEFQGPDITTLTLGIKLRKWLGVNPESCLEILRSYCETGEVLTFVVSGKPVGKKWLIESVEATATHYIDGTVAGLDVNLSMQEYYEATTNSRILGGVLT